MLKLTVAVGDRLISASLMRRESSVSDRSLEDSFLRESPARQGNIQAQGLDTDFRVSKKFRLSHSKPKHSKDVAESCLPSESLVSTKKEVSVDLVKTNRLLKSRAVIAAVDLITGRQQEEYQLPSSLRLSAKKDAVTFLAKDKSLFEAGVVITTLTACSGALGYFSVATNPRSAITMVSASALCAIGFYVKAWRESKRDKTESDKNYKKVDDEALSDLLLNAETISPIGDLTLARVGSSRSGCVLILQNNIVLFMARIKGRRLGIVESVSTNDRVVDIERKRGMLLCKVSERGFLSEWKPPKVFKFAV